MELYLVRHDLYDRLYNCSFYDVNSISIEQRQHKVFGALFIALALISEVAIELRGRQMVLVQRNVVQVLYVPCAISIWKHRENSCYKIMVGPFGTPLQLNLTCSSTSPSTTCAAFGYVVFSTVTSRSLVRSSAHIRASST